MGGQTLSKRILQGSVICELLGPRGPITTDRPGLLAGKTKGEICSVRLHICCEYTLLI